MNSEQVFSQHSSVSSSSAESLANSSEVLSHYPEVVVQRYELLEKLGKGSQGQVWKARRKSDGELVAIKQLNVHSVTTWKQYELFKREADTLASLKIDGVVPFCEYIEDLSANPPYVSIVQKFIEGQTLAAMLKKNHRFKAETIYDIVAQILKVLQQLHGHKPPVVHRDIKPSNIMLTQVDEDHYKITLLDFGAVANPQVQNGGSTVAGTFGYMPPEQLMGQACAASDIYALAAVTVEMLSGTSPADIEVCDFKLVIEPYLEHLDAAVVQTLEHMLEPSMAHRFCDYNALIAQFSNLANQKKPSVLSFLKKSSTPKLEEVVSICQSGNYEVWQAFESDKAIKYLKHLIGEYKEKCKKLEHEINNDPLIKQYNANISHYRGLIEDNSRGNLSFTEIRSYIEKNEAGIRDRRAELMGKVNLEKQDQDIGCIIALAVICCFFMPLSLLLMIIFIVYKVLKPIFNKGLKDKHQLIMLNKESINLEEPPFELEKIEKIWSQNCKLVGKIVRIEYMSIRDSKSYAVHQKGIDNDFVFTTCVPCFKVSYQYRLPNDILKNILKDMPISTKVSNLQGNHSLCHLEFYGETIVHTSPEQYYKIGDMIPLVIGLYELKPSIYTLNVMPYPFPFADVQNDDEFLYTLMISEQMIQSQSEEEFQDAAVHFMKTELPKASEEWQKWYDLLIQNGYVGCLTEIVHLLPEEIGVKVLQNAAKSNHVKAMIKLARYYNENKKYKLAFKWYMQAFDMGEIQLYPEILRLEVDKKDYKTWTAWVEYLVSMFTELANDGDIDAILQLVEIYEYIDDSDNVLVWLTKAVHLGDISSMEKLIRIYIEKKEYDKIIALVDEILKQKPNDADITIKYAELYFKMEKYSHAAQCYQKALQCMPQSDSRYRKVQSDLELCQLIVQDGKNDVNENKLLQVARVFRGNNDFQNALKWYDKARFLGSAMATREALDICIKRGDRALALIYYVWLAEQHHDAGAARAAGLLYQELGDFERAKSYLRRYTILKGQGGH